MPRMSMGTRQTDQPPLWIAASVLPASPGHPFYARLNEVLDTHGFDRFAENQCRAFYAKVMGRPCLTLLAQATGIETPTREDLARLDRKRKKKTSNKDWTNPYDPDAKVTKMKDGRTHLAHKAEHAVDLETGAIVAVTLQGADEGDTTIIRETATAAAEQVEDAQADVDEPQALEEIIGDKGYHSNQSMVDLDAVGIRSYIAEPDRGRR